MCRRSRTRAISASVRRKGNSNPLSTRAKKDDKMVQGVICAALFFLLARLFLWGVAREFVPSFSIPRHKNVSAEDERGESVTAFHRCRRGMMYTMTFWNMTRMSYLCWKESHLRCRVDWCDDSKKLWTEPLTRSFVVRLHIPYLRRMPSPFSSTEHLRCRRELVRTDL